MQQEYTTKTGLKIFYGITAVLLTGAAIFLFAVLKVTPTQPVTIFLFPLVLFAGAVLLVVNLLIRKVTITETSIKSVNVFMTRELLFSEIKGCRVGPKTIVAVPLSADKRSVIINNYSDLEGSDNLPQWFRDNFKDLDSADLKQEQEAVLNDPNLGFSQQEREAKLKKAKLVAVAYNLLCIPLIIAAIVNNSKPVIILLIIYPLLSIPIMLLSKGLIKLVSNPKRSVAAYATFGVFLPSFLLMIIGLSTYDLYRHGLYLIILMVLAVIVAGVWYVTGVNKAASSPSGQAVGMFIAALIYSAGFVTEVNCAFDNSAPDTLQTAVIAKNMQYSKGEHYYLTLAAWDGSATTRHIEVSYEFYGSIPYYGAYVHVNMKKGLLGVPWFYLTQ